MSGSGRPSEEELQAAGATLVEREPGANGAVPAAPYVAPPARTLEQVVETFESWLHLPDPRALLATLGAIAANLLPGDPVWLLLVGPGGFGKSELLQALGRLPYARSAGTLTEASLLSGTPKRERSKRAKGGLLRELGDFGVIVLKDFGSILSMSRDARAEVLAALREVYDGAWTRHVGSDGGMALEWRGKVGLIGGCTPILDRHHAVMTMMGERFMLYRLPRVDDAAQARRALEHAEHGATMRAELAEAVAGLFGEDGRSPPHAPRDLAPAEREHLIALATLVVHARAGVERDSHSREIELVPDAEAPGRLTITLERLLAGLDSLGLERAAAWQVVGKVALDCIPALRVQAIEALLADGEPSGESVAAALGLPPMTARRTLEELQAHGLAAHTSDPGKSHRWTLTEKGRGLWEAATAGPAVTPPEMAGHL